MLFPLPACLDADLATGACLAGQAVTGRMYRSQLRQTDVCHTIGQLGELRHEDLEEGSMEQFAWSSEERRRFDAIRADLAMVSTASACQLMIGQGWRNTYMVGLLPLRPAGLGQRQVGRARTCQYLMRRGPEPGHDPAARRRSPEISLIESIDAGDIFCVDALGVPTAGIIGDILTARLQARGVLAAVINGAVRDSPYIAALGMPVYASAVHPAHSGRDLEAADFDQPLNMAGVQVHSGDVLLADDEGVVAMPLELAEYVAAAGPQKERIEEWIREKIVAGKSVHDYYPPSPEKALEYEQETGEQFHFLKATK